MNSRGEGEKVSWSAEITQGVLQMGAVAVATNVMRWIILEDGHIAMAVPEFCAGLALLWNPTEEGALISLLSDSVCLLVIISMPILIVFFVMTSEKDDFPHKFHHSVIIMGAWLYCIFAMLERRGLVFKGAAALIVAAGFMQAAILFGTHHGRDNIETHMHFMLIPSWTLAAFGAARLGIKPHPQWGRLVMAYGVCLNALCLIVNAMWMSPRWTWRNATWAHGHSVMMLVQVVVCALAIGVLTAFVVRLSLHYHLHPELDRDGERAYEKVVPNYSDVSDDMEQAALTVPKKIKPNVLGNGKI